MNKKNNKKVGLRSARMRQLAGMRQLTPANSFQAVKVTIPSSTPPITTLTLTANKMSDSSNYNYSSLYYEPETESLNFLQHQDKYGFCRPVEIYFYLGTDITNIITQNIETIIIDYDDISLTLIVEIVDDHDSSIDDYITKKPIYYVSKVMIKNKNNSDVITEDDDDINLITRYIETEKKYYRKVSGSYVPHTHILSKDDCPYTELKFSLSFKNAL